MNDLRTRFAERFGSDLATTIESAIERHTTKKYPLRLERGSDPFRFALVWAIGFECLGGCVRNRVGAPSTRGDARG